jgi:hypothetical protein
MIHLYSLFRGIISAIVVSNTSVLDVNYAYLFLWVILQMMHLSCFMFKQAYNEPNKALI